MNNSIDIAKTLDYLKDASPVVSETSVKTLEPSPMQMLKNTWTRELSKGYRSNLLIKISHPKGLGVFADRDYEKDEALEYCHCIVSEWKSKYIHDPAYKRYAYWENCSCEDCKKHGTRGIILLGTGSIINSVEKEEQRNVHIELQGGLSLAVVVAVKNIKKGEELLAWHGEAYFNAWCKPRLEAHKKRAIQRRKATEDRKTVIAEELSV